MPPDLAVLLEREPRARQFFDGLSYSQRPCYVVAIEQAKTPQALS